MRKYPLHKNIHVSSGLILQITFSSSLTCVPSDTFNTEFCSEQGEFCHTCLQKTSLGEGASPGGKKLLQVWCWRHFLGHQADGVDGSGKWLRAPHSSYMTYPASKPEKSQRKATGPGSVLAPSAGEIEHRQNPTLILSCAICFKVSQPRNTNPLRSKPP